MSELANAPVFAVSRGWRKITRRRGKPWSSVLTIELKMLKYVQKTNVSSTDRNWIEQKESKLRRKYRDRKTRKNDEV